MKSPGATYFIRQPRNILFLGVFVLACGVFGSELFHRHMIHFENLTQENTLSATSSIQQVHKNISEDIFTGDVAARDRLLALFVPNDSDSIFTVVDTIQADSNLSRNCHEIAHELGKHAYAMYGFSDAMTFNNPKHVSHTLVQYICAGGYLHGILEALLLDKPQFMDDPGATCMLLPEVDRVSCFHGIGHVLMIAAERSADTAISNCRKISENMNMYRCFEGARMEQFWGNPGHTTGSALGWDIEKPLQPCIDATLDAKPTCFLYSPFGYLRAHPKDYSGAVALCTSKTISPSDTQFCLKGLGITMMSKFKGKNLEGSVVYVKGLQEDERFSFYQGVLGYARLSGVPIEELESTCRLFENDQTICAEALSGVE